MSDLAGDDEDKEEEEEEERGVGRRRRRAWWEGGVCVFVVVFCVLGLCFVFWVCVHGSVHVSVLVVFVLIILGSRSGSGFFFLNFLGM